MKVLILLIFVLYTEAQNGILPFKRVGGIFSLPWKTTTTETTTTSTIAQTTTRSSTTTRTTSETTTSRSSPKSTSNSTSTPTRSSFTTTTAVSWRHFPVNTVTPNSTRVPSTSTTLAWLDFTITLPPSTTSNSETWTKSNWTGWPRIPLTSTSPKPHSTTTTTRTPKTTETIPSTTTKTTMATRTTPEATTTVSNATTTTTPESTTTVSDATTAATTTTPESTTVSDASTEPSTPDGTSTDDGWINANIFRHSNFSWTPNPKSKPAMPVGPVILSRIFNDFEEMCPDNLPVRAFSYKIIDNGTAKDYALKAVCYDKLELADGNALNLSSAECYYKKAFSIDYDNIYANDTGYMCSAGEYINGAQSEYWEGTRLLRMKCCKASFLQHSSEFGCRAWTLEQSRALLEYRKSPKCPFELLTGIGLREPGKDDIVAQYCGVATETAYSDICDSDRAYELQWLKGWAYARTPVPFTKHTGNRSNPIYHSGDQTMADEDLTLTCADYDAIDSVQVEDVGGDFVFRFGCQPVAPKAWATVHKSVTQFQSMFQIIQSDTHCYPDRNEIMCGIDSYVGETDVDASVDRFYSFQCCELANAMAVDGNQMEVNTTTFDNSTGRAWINRPGYFLVKMQIVYEKNSTVSPILITGWSMYNVTDIRPIKITAASQSHMQLQFSHLSVTVLCAAFVLVRFLMSDV